MKKLSRGFTLIELLVVIAIIGILSSVVLASLNTARGKGADAAAKSNIDNMRSQAELVYDQNSGLYAPVCTDATVMKGVTAAATSEGFTWASTADNSADVTCVSSNTAWLTYVHLVKGSGASWWCADNTGVSRAEGASPGATATVCP